MATSSTTANQPKECQNFTFDGLIQFPHGHPFTAAELQTPDLYLWFPYKGGNVLLPTQSKFWFPSKGELTWFSAKMLCDSACDEDGKPIPDLYYDPATKTVSTVKTSPYVIPVVQILSRCRYQEWVLFNRLCSHHMTAPPEATPIVLRPLPLLGDKLTNFLLSKHPGNSIWTDLLKPENLETLFRSVELAEIYNITYFSNVSHGLVVNMLSRKTKEEVLAITAPISKIPIPRDQLPLPEEFSKCTTDITGPDDSGPFYIIEDSGLPVAEASVSS